MRINPSLSVDAVFQVGNGADLQRSRLNLRDHPGLAAWLISILDFVSGRAAAIAAPPGGPTRELLIVGRVLVAQLQPDGRPALQLQPQFDLSLQLYVRRPGECAHCVNLPLAANPDVSRWLLENYPERPEGRALPDGALGTELRRHSVLVEDLPPDEAWFPDAADPVDQAAELATAAGVFMQRAGEPLPQAVRDVLGRHTPDLPPGTDLIWTSDPGTGMMYPMRWTGEGKPVQSPEPGKAGVARIEFWSGQLRAARTSLASKRFAHLRAIVPGAQCAKLQRHMRELVKRGYFPALGDGQVELRSALHNQPTAAALHNGLAGIVNSIAGEPVIASYCYLACYEEGAVLHRHKDRQQCAYNLSLVLDMQNSRGDPEPWPIFLELDGKPEAVELQVGDGLCYSGTDVWHWREALPPGQRAIICFYHFVPRDFAGSLD